MDNPYEMLWNEKYSGKVGIYDDYREAMTMVMLKNGVSDINTRRSQGHRRSQERADRAI